MNTAGQTDITSDSGLPPYTPAAPVELTGPAPAKLAPSNVIHYEPEAAIPMTTTAPQVNTKSPESQRVTPLLQLGEQPQWIDCDFCQRRALTRVEKEGTGMQMIAGAVCCLFCVCLTCVPCLAGWFENTNYFCSNCNRKVATRPHNGPIQIYSRENQTVSLPLRFPTAPPSAPTK